MIDLSPHRCVLCDTRVALVDGDCAGQLQSHLPGHCEEEANPVTLLGLPGQRADADKSRAGPILGQIFIINVQPVLRLVQ